MAQVLKLGALGGVGEPVGERQVELGSPQGREGAVIPE